MEELIKYLEDKMNQCKEFGGMEKEHWAFTQAYKKAQVLQLHKTQVSGSFIEDSEKLSDDIIKYFPKFFDDFTNFEYGTGRDAGKDFKKIFNKAKRLKTKICKNYR